MITFEDLNLKSEIISGLREYGYQNPNVNEQLFLPVILSGKNCVLEDVYEMSALGSYQIGILQRITTSVSESSGKMDLQVLVICRTRELARNRALILEQKGKYLNIKVPSVIAGTGLREDISMLTQHDYPILYGTPGRIVDYIQRRLISLDLLKCLVLDGLDEVGDEEMLVAIREIISLLPYNAENDAAQTQLIAKVGCSLNDRTRERIHQFIGDAEYLVTTGENR